MVLDWAKELHPHAVAVGAIPVAGDLVRKGQADDGRVRAANTNARQPRQDGTSGGSRSDEVFETTLRARLGQVEDVGNSKWLVP